MNSSVGAVRAVKEKKVDLRNSEQLLSVVFSTFGGPKNLKKFKKNILMLGKKIMDFK
jgi:hypothetical protein